MPDDSDWRFKVTRTESESAALQDESFLDIQGVDYVELYVGNSRQAAYFFCAAFGFTPLAYAGLETGVRDRMSYVLTQGTARLVLTAPLDAQSAVAQHVNRHGDGVKDIAFSVHDARAAFEYTVRRGAQAVMEPTVFEDEQGRVIKATVAAFGDTVHTFVQRADYIGTFLPFYAPLTQMAAEVAKPMGVSEIDHFGISVEAGMLNGWVDFYTKVFGFQHVHEEHVVTANSAMHSSVVQDRSGVVKFPMQEPAPGKRKSQIEEYLASYDGSGVQHLALATDDIVATVAALRKSGIEFLYTPDSYYALLEDRVGKIEEEIPDLQKQHILVDRDEWGYLLQIFSKPVQSRPTFFVELIQRKEARGFGSGNIRALFEAVERDQALRGNL